MGCASSKTEDEDIKRKKQKLNTNTRKPKQSLRGEVYRCKVALLGDKYVGKSSIVRRLCNNEFFEQYDVTMGVAYSQKIFQTKSNQNVRFHLWDTAGEEKFRSMLTFYYRDADVILLVFDITNDVSFKHLEYWKNEIENRSKKDSLVWIIGNKTDCDESSRVVRPEEISNYAAFNKYNLYYTSAKNGTGVNEIFEDLIKHFEDKEGVRFKLDTER